MSEAEQQEWRDRFRDHWEAGVAFNIACGFVVRRWGLDGVEVHVALRDDLTGHPDVFHGGVLSTLIDVAGCAAVAAGHDYSKGNRITTVSMAVQYLSVDPGQGATAVAHCTRRGRQISYSDVSVRSDAGKELAHGLVTVSVSGQRSGQIA